MNRTQTTLLLIVSVLLSMGFADCHFNAGSVVYKLNACPPKDFKWPVLAKTERLEAQREEKYRYSDNSECHKLIRYSMRENLKKDQWGTYNNYVGAIAGQPCRLVVSTYRIGPPDYRDEAEGKEALKQSIDPFVNILLKGTPYKAEFPAEKVEIISGRDEYSEWCKRLPLPELSEGK